MAAILERMEEELRSRAGLGAGAGRADAVVDTEFPSFVDDMCADIVIWENCNNNMQRVEANVKRIVREVAEECNLPIETDKEEVLYMRRSLNKRNADPKWVKCLGVIFDDSLDFDMHWKSRIAKARKALGALSGVGGSQWGMCPDRKSVV